MCAAQSGGGSWRRRAFGIAAVGLVGLGIYLSDWFRGPGLGGSGSGDGSARTETSPGDDATSPAGAEQVSTTSTTDDAAASPSNAAAGARESIIVLIEGNEYRLPIDPDAIVTVSAAPVGSDFRTATLAEVVALAKSTSGNANGIHVDVYRHRNATSGARAALVEALQDAGYRPGEIHLRDEFYE
jgi:hypothetical protein